MTRYAKATTIYIGNERGRLSKGTQNFQLVMFLSGFNIKIAFEGSNLRPLSTINKRRQEHLIRPNVKHLQAFTKEGDY